MNQCYPIVSAFLAVFASAATLSGNLQGTWQGSIPLQTESRYLFTIDQTGRGKWAATAIIGEDWGQKLKAENVTVEGNRIRFLVKIPGQDSTYDGLLSSNGTTIAGTWEINNSPLTLNLVRATPKNEWKEPRHRTMLVSVEKNVKLEVLDWGGTGRPMILLAGLGNTAHPFGDFAVKLAKNFHVYGITRRGIGASSVPPVPAFPTRKVSENSYDISPTGPGLNPYDANRLGDDVIEVIRSLNIRRPILVAHSLGGEELTSIASRYPHLVAGLIYLDAFYDYAYTDGETSDALFTPTHPWHLTLPPGHPLELDPTAATLLGMHEFRSIPIPALAICAVPMIVPPMLRGDTKAIAAFDEGQQKVAARYDRIEPLLPNVRIIRLPNSAHLVFRSNEADVLREIDAFVSKLPK